MEKEIILNNAVLHILDTNINMPVLSGQELIIDEDISDFLGRHVLKILEDSDLKQAQFIDQNNNIKRLCESLSGDRELFLSISCDMANMLFDIMQKNVDIASGDLIFLLFNINSQRYLGILKLNYKSGFTHYVINSGEGNINSIVKHRTILPSGVQKVDECIIINLEDLSIELIEKEYEIDGSKELYLSNRFLKCSSELSNRSKLKIINDATKKISKKYFDEDFENVAKMKKAISESLEESDSININSIAREVFRNNLELQNEYISEINKSGIVEEALTIPEDLAGKKFKTHKIKTDNGIEINFPIDYYNNNEKIEFINNIDGTISILIKNVGKIVNR